MNKFSKTYAKHFTMNVEARVTVKVVYVSRIVSITARGKRNISTGRFDIMVAKELKQHTVLLDFSLRHRHPGQQKDYSCLQKVGEMLQPRDPVLPNPK
jgi:hypothetical protein